MRCVTSNPDAHFAAEADKVWHPANHGFLPNKYRFETASSNMSEIKPPKRLVLWVAAVILLVALAGIAGYGVFRLSRPPSVDRAKTILRDELDQYSASEGLDHEGFTIRSIEQERYRVVFDVIHPGPPKHLLLIYVGYTRVVEFHRMIEDGESNESEG